MDVAASISQTDDTLRQACTTAAESAPQQCWQGAILVISDDRHVATLLQFLFEREGFSVTPLVDGHAAMQYLAQETRPPAMVLLDIILPIVDGYEIMRQIAAHPGWGMVPIIVLTGRSDETDVVRAFACGADDYITKPFQIGEVIARVKRLIEERAH